MIIRNETPADVDAITDVTTRAFETPAYSSHTEQFIVLALRRAGVLTISLVADLDGRVVGHVVRELGRAAGHRGLRPPR
jgi:putative acetyltransferase